MGEVYRARDTQLGSAFLVGLSGRAPRRHCGVLRLPRRAAARACCRLADRSASAVVDFSSKPDQCAWNELLQLRRSKAEAAAAGGRSRLGNYGHLISLCVRRAPTAGWISRRWGCSLSPVGEVFGIPSLRGHPRLLQHYSCRLKERMKAGLLTHPGRGQECPVHVRVLICTHASRSPCSPHSGWSVARHSLLATTGVWKRPTR
jgi:hypothetical protein